MMDEMEAMAKKYNPFKYDTRAAWTFDNDGVVQI